MDACGSSGTHEGEIYSHVETYDDKNLLARGQSIEDRRLRCRDLVPEAGQFSCTTNASCMVQMLTTQIGCGSVSAFIRRMPSTIGRRPFSGPRC